MKILKFIPDNLVALNLIEQATIDYECTGKKDLPNYPTVRLLNELECELIHTKTNILTDITK